MRVVADHVRSVADADVGRRRARQRGPRLHPAPAHAPHRALPCACSACEGATFPELFLASRDAMKSAYPEVASDWDRIEPHRLRRGGDIPPHARGGTSILDLAVAPDQARGQQPAHRRHRLPAARHLRVPDRPHRRDGRGGRAQRRPRRVRPPDVRAARPGQGRCQGQEEDHRRPLGVRRVPQRGRDRLHRLRLPAGRRERARHPRRRRLRRPGDRRARPPRSSSPRARCIPSRAVRRPTPAASSVPGTSSQVLDVQRPIKGLISHRVEVVSGEVGVGDAATTVVDPVWRKGATQAHSATHLIHAALRQVLGPDAHQAGSYNKAGYMRLDFNWSKPLSAATRSEIEGIANDAIQQDFDVVTRDPSYRRGQGARRHGPVRREVRRHRPDGRHRRPMVARALRGHACLLERRDRPDQPRGRGLDRLHRASHRVARRSRGLPRVRHRAGDRLAALERAEGAEGSDPESHRRPPRQPQGGGEADRGVRAGAAQRARPRARRDRAPCRIAHRGRRDGRLAAERR